MSQYRFKQNNDIKMFVTELCQKELLVLLMAAPILMLEVSRNNMNLNIQRCFQSLALEYGLNGKITSPDYDSL